MLLLLKRCLLIPLRDRDWIIYIFKAIAHFALISILTYRTIISLLHVSIYNNVLVHIERDDALREFDTTYI